MAMAFYVSTGPIIAQIYLPPAFDMSGGANYVLNSHNQNSTAYPPNMAIRFCGDCTATGNFTTDLTAEADHQPGGGAGKWRGENGNGVSVRGGTNMTRGSFLLRLNTTSRMLINVSWVVRDIVINGNTNYIELQWRIGSTGAWNNVENDLYQQGSTPSGTSYSVLLPAQAANQTDLRVRWIYYEIGSGARDRLAIDDILVTSDVLLPLTVSNLSVQETPTGADLEWITATMEGIEYFVVEYSTDLIKFENLDVILPSVMGLNSFHHSKESMQGLQHYYRVKQVDLDGQIHYTPVVQLTVKAEAINIYPTIAKDYIMVNGSYTGTIHLVNEIGQFVTSIKTESGVPIGISHLARGRYYLLVADHKTLAPIPMIKA